MENIEHLREVDMGDDWKINEVNKILIVTHPKFLDAFIRVLK